MHRHFIRDGRRCRLLWLLLLLLLGLGGNGLGDRLLDGGTLLLLVELELVDQLLSFGQLLLEGRDIRHGVLGFCNVGGER